MRDTPTPPDYEPLTLSELDAAASSPDLKSRCAHLNRAGVLAYLGECARDEAQTSRRRTEAWERSGTIAYAKRAALLAALEHCNYNLKRAASRLEISRGAVYRMMDIYCIEQPIEIVSVETKEEVDAGDIDIRKKNPMVSSRLELKDGNLVIVAHAREV
jgi:hypothetical protein